MEREKQAEPGGVRAAPNQLHGEPERYDPEKHNDRPETGVVAAEHVEELLLGKRQCHIDHLALQQLSHAMCQAGGSADTLQFQGTNARSEAVIEAERGMPMTRRRPARSGAGIPVSNDVCG